MEQAKIKEEETHPLALLQGGKGPFGSPWMDSMGTGTIFLCRPISDPSERPNPFLEQWHIVGGEGRYRLLLTNLNKRLYSYVDSHVFCATRDLVSVQKGADNGSGYPLQPGDVDDNGAT